MNFLKKRKSLLDYNNRGINDKIERPSSLVKGRDSNFNRQQSAVRNSHVFPIQGQSRNLVTNNSKSPNKANIKRTRTLAHDQSTISNNSGFAGNNFSSIDKSKGIGLYKAKSGLPTAADPKRATPKHKLTENMRGSLFQIMNANSKVRSNSRPGTSYMQGIK